MNGKYRDEILTYLLALASHSVSIDFFGAIRKRGITARQWRVLGTLWDEDSLTLKELSAAVFCEQSTTTRMVERLHAMDLIGRRDDTVDQRKVHIYLTAKGKESIKELVELSRTEEKKIAKIVGADRIITLKEQLRELIERFNPAVS